MQNVIKQIEATFKACLDKEAELTAELQKTHTLAAELKKAQEDISAQKTALDAREKEIKRVEDVVALEVRANDLMDLANKRMEEVQGSIKALDEERARWQKEAKETHAKNETMAADIEKREARVKELEQSLEKEVLARVQEVLGKKK